MRRRTETTTITEHEAAQIERANATTATPVVFVHGLWLLPSSWERWAALFEEAGFVALTPGWPDDPETVEEAKAHPEVFAGKTVGEVADHVEAIIRRLDRKPAVIGHSFGGLLTEILAGRGLAAVSVAISPAPFRGVLPLPISALRAASAALKNPANYNRAVPLTYDQFRFAFANALGEDEAKALYEAYSVAAPGAPLPGRDREPELVDGGEGRHQEPRSRAAARHLRRAGSHRPEGDREGVVQQGEAQPGRNRIRRDEGAWPRPHDRRRLARGRRHRPRLRQAVRLIARHQPASPCETRPRAGFADGQLPPGAARLVRNCADLRRVELERYWERAEQMLALEPIEPPPVMAPRLDSAVPLDPYVVRVVFADGEIREVDIEPLLKGPIFQPLHNPALFAQVAVDEYVWPNGADLDPDVLYGIAKPAGEPAPRVTIPQQA